MERGGSAGAAARELLDLGGRLQASRPLGPAPGSRLPQASLDEELAAACPGGLLDRCRDRPGRGVDCVSEQ